MSYNERSKQNTIKYIEENLDTIRFRVRRGEKDALIKQSQAEGYSAYSRYIIDAVNEKAGYKILTMPRERDAKKDFLPQPNDQKGCEHEK